MLETLYKKTALPGFDDRNSDEQSIDDVTEELTRLFQSSQRKIKELSKLGISEQSDKMSKNIQNSLATRMQDLSNTFRKSQGKYLKSKRLMGEISNSTISKELRKQETQGAAVNFQTDDKDDDDENLDAVCWCCFCAYRLFLINWTLSLCVLG